QIHRMPEAEAHLEDDAALEHARGHGRVTAGAEEDGVMAAQRLELLIGQRLTRLVPALGADGVIGELEIDGLTRDLDGALEDLETFGDDLIADSVTRHDCDLELHAHTIGRYLIIQLDCPIIWTVVCADAMARRCSDLPRPDCDVPMNNFTSPTLLPTTHLGPERGRWA